MHQVYSTCTTTKTEGQSTWPHPSCTPGSQKPWEEVCGWAGGEAAMLIATIHDQVAPGPVPFKVWQRYLTHSATTGASWQGKHKTGGKDGTRKKFKDPEQAYLSDFKAFGSTMIPAILQPALLQWATEHPVQFKEDIALIGGLGVLRKATPIASAPSPSPTSTRKQVVQAAKDCAKKVRRWGGVSVCSVAGVGVHAGIYSGIMAASTRRQCNVNLR